MANLIEFINYKIKPYLKTVTIIFITILFIGAGYYYYYNVYLKNYKNNKYKDVANENNRKKEIMLYFISVPWCPYCKKAEPEWETFYNQYDGKPINNVNVNCVKVSESDTNFEKITTDYKVDKYPTVFIVYDEKRIDFDAAVTHYSLEQFVQKVANDIK